MSAIGWAIVLLLPVYAAVQLVLLVVLGRRFALRAGDEPPGPVVGYRHPAAAEEPTDESLVCPACGSHNDRGYRFCRACVSRLAAR